MCFVIRVNLIHQIDREIQVHQARQVGVRVIETGVQDAHPHVRCAQPAGGPGVVSMDRLEIPLERGEKEGAGRIAGTGSPHCLAATDSLVWDDVQHRLLAHCFDPGVARQFGERGTAEPGNRGEVQPVAMHHNRAAKLPDLLGEGRRGDTLLEDDQVTLGDRCTLAGGQARGLGNLVFVGAALTANEPGKECDGCGYGKATWIHSGTPGEENARL
jgi:hypothetical protein